MKKYLPHILILVVAVGLFAPIFSVYAQGGAVPPNVILPPGAVPASAVANSLPEFEWSNVSKVATDILLLPLGWLMTSVILPLATLLTFLAGAILNYIVQYSVVNMAKNLKEIGAIDEAWRVIRDIANMAFIFVLLYAAIKTILGMGGETQKLIKNVIIVAILINFSLFFTKLVIDTSNVLAVMFYDVIAPGALTNTAPSIFGSAGIADSLMDPLKLTTLFDIKGLQLSGTRLVVIGVMGTIVSLIAAFVFFAIAIMFVIRFVILIFVLILSPLAFIAFILPALEDKRKQWLNALLGQAFFAPIYFMLTFIVIVVSRGLVTSAGQGGTMAEAFGGAVGASGEAIAPSLSSIVILMNFIIVIVFLIASLIIAKEWADKAGPGAAGLTKWAMGAAGGATLGMAGRFVRTVIGSRAAEMASNEELKIKAAEGNLRARLQLAAASKVAKSSFDIRGLKAAGVLEAGKAQKGGFIQDQKDRAKAYERYKPSEDAKKEVKSKTATARGELEEARKRAEEGARASVPKPREFTEAEKEFDEARKEAAAPSRLVGISDEVRMADEARKKTRVETAEKKVTEEKKKHDEAVKTYIKNRTATEEKVYSEIQAVEKEMTTRMENMAKRMESSMLAPIIPQGGLLVSGKSKANAIRAVAKGKSTKERATELVKDIQKEEGGGEEETPPTPPAEETPPTTT